MTKGYLCPTREAGGWPVQGSQPFSETNVVKTKMSHQEGRRAHSILSMHPFRSGGGVSRALAGDSTSTMMQRTVKENPPTASRYMRLMEVVFPGTEGYVRVEGISDNQYREFTEFPLSELSRSWAAFANNPMLKQEFERAELARKTGDTNCMKNEYGRNNGDPHSPD